MSEISDIIIIVIPIVGVIVGWVGVLMIFGRVASVNSEGFEFRAFLPSRRFVAWSEIRKPAKFVKGAVGVVPRVEFMFSSTSFFTFRRGLAVIIRKRDLDKRFVEELDQRVGLLYIEKFRDLLR